MYSNSEKIKGNLTKRCPVYREKLKHTMIYGYLRAIENCSPERDISLNKQLESLNSEGISIIYQDIVSRETNGKENFYILFDKLVQSDIVIITKLSRIADSLTELTEICSLFSSKGIILKVLDLGDLTVSNDSISTGNWLYALRRFEEDIKYEKICIGHLISKKNHQLNNSIPCGKPAKYSKKQLGEALKLRDRYTFKEIANITGISKSTLLRASKSCK